MKKLLKCILLNAVWEDVNLNVVALKYLLRAAPVLEDIRSEKIFFSFVNWVSYGQSFYTM